MVAPAPLVGTAAVLVLCLAERAQARRGVPRPAVSAGQGNVLLIVADDLGVDRVGAYAEHPEPGSTPRIDRLARRGVLFRNAWAFPSCSPTRATLLTGRYGFRTGVGTAVTFGHGPGQPGDPPPPDFALADSEWTLPEVLRDGGATHYTSVALGKWHLAMPEHVTHPLEAGFSHYAGALGNLVGFEDYFHWFKCTDGVLGLSTTYATTDTTDDAVALVPGLTEPWFLYVAYNAPHHPFHAPPPHLHTQDLTPPATKVERMKAMTEAVDTEIGRLLDSLSPAVRERTTVIFVGDNGTAAGATDAPFLPKHAKTTLYEGGVNVPLIVAGQSVVGPGRECGALVGAVDLFATVLELCGLDPGAPPAGAPPHDSVSLVPYFSDPTHPPLRATVYAERFAPNGFGPYGFHDRAIRGPRYKLIHRSAATEELYDLREDPFELDDLLAAPLAPEASAAYDELSVALASLQDG